MKSYSYASDTFDRTIVVGDIHGCYVELQELCRIVNFGARDALVSVGDFLDRGPDSRKVAAFFRDLPNAFSVLGNHERRVAGTIRGTSKPAWSQEQTLSLLPKEEWDYWECFLAHFPGQSCQGLGLDRLFRGSHRHISNPVCPRRSCP